MAVKQKLEKEIAELTRAKKALKECKARFRTLTETAACLIDICRLPGIVRDTTERKQTQAQLLHNAFHDALTGLPNRTLFMERLGRAIEYSKRHKNLGLTH